MPTPKELQSNGVDLTPMPLPPDDGIRGEEPADVFATMVVSQLIPTTPPPSDVLSWSSAESAQDLEDVIRARRRMNRGVSGEHRHTAIAAPLGALPHSSMALSELHKTNPAAANRLAAAVSAFPLVGTKFLGFQIEDELGRGAFGRVYLARQGELADRPVALKVTADLTGEPQTLAQLQHTNIVPVYSVHRSGSVQAVCMPYLGSVTLDDVIGGLRGRESVPGSGEHFVSTLNHLRSRTATGPSSPPLSAPARPAAPAPTPAPLGRTAVATNDILRRLSRLSYVDAALWLGARLADGLAHAHDRGIIHRDMKPANVLLTDEGQPMLLDFNLAEDAAARAEAAVALVGGTLPYMSPEQLEAFRTRTGTIDARSDLYSLGLMLFELLAGRHPFPTPTGPVGLIVPQMIADRQEGPPSLRAFSPGVSPAAEAIVLRCLHPNQSQRYQTAHALREDIERHLANLPLRHTREPSLRERVRKWSRRNPRISSTGAVVGLSMLLMVGLASAVFVRDDQLARHEATASWNEFQKDKRRVEVNLGAGTLQADLLDDELANARALLGRYGLPEDAAWQQRPAVARLSDLNQRALRLELGELLFVTASATAVQAERSEPQLARTRLAQAALLSERAVECYRPDELAWVVQNLRDELAARMNGQPWNVTRPPPRSVREAYLAAADLATRGQYSEALPLIEYAVKNQPDLFPARFVLANCYAGLEQDVAAEAAYDVCVALAPNFAQAYHARGLARLRLKDYAGAESDFETVLRLRPDIAARLNRAAARHGRGDFRSEIEDLTAALNMGASPEKIHALRAEAWKQLGDTDAAARDAAFPDLLLEQNAEKGLVEQ